MFSQWVMVVQGSKMTTNHDDPYFMLDFKDYGRLFTLILQTKVFLQQNIVFCFKFSASSTPSMVPFHEHHFHLVFFIIAESYNKWIFMPSCSVWSTLKVHVNEWRFRSACEQISTTNMFHVFCREQVTTKHELTFPLIYGKIWLLVSFLEVICEGVHIIFPIWIFIIEVILWDLPIRKTIIWVLLV